MEKGAKEDNAASARTSMDTVVGSAEEEKGSTPLQTVETLLRLFPTVLCVTALVIMLKDSQTTTDFGSITSLDLGGFKYLVYANGICAGYSLLSAFCTAVARSTTMSRAWTLFFFDQILTYTILAAGAIATEVLYLAYKGDEAASWSEACVTFGGFCRKATSSVIITFAAVVCYAGLSFISSYRVFSRYDPPASYPSNKGVENAVFEG